MNPNVCVALAVALFCSASALAENGPMVLDPVVVVASKRPLLLSEVAGQISVISAQEIQFTLTENLDDLLRYEPGVDVASAGTRFGGESVTLRGVGGNRVAIEVDGVPVRNGFAIGSYSNAGRLLVETNRIKRLEILHGPASTMYGTDALGGILAFTTWDPVDLVVMANGPAWFGASTGYDAADQSWNLSGQAATLQGPHGLLFSATARDGHEAESAAADSEELDPQDWSTRDYALRYTFSTGTGDELRIGLERFTSEARTDVQSLLGYGRFATTTLLEGDDSDDRTQALVDFSFTRPWLDGGIARAFMVESNTLQNTLEERAGRTPPSRISRSFELNTRMWGAELTGYHTVPWGSTDHTITGGLEYLVTDLEELRNGSEENLTTGDISSSVLGETFPTRDFPNSTTRELGIYLQDEIVLGASRWSLVPALRYERYTLDPSPDPLYTSAFPDATLVSVDEDRGTPRLAVRYAFNQRWSVYGQIAEGFRAPPAEDVNIGFELPRLRFRAIPNPDLESETSRGYELGLRYFSPTSRLEVTWFDTRFENLIESRARIGFDPVSGFLEFQSRNIGEARIYGADLRYDQDLATWSNSLDAWSLRLAAYWSRGDNESNDEPLNTIAPPQAVLGLAWRSANERLEATLNTTLTARQTRVDDSGGELFQPPSSTVLDLIASWHLHSRVTLRAGLFNLTDQAYWRWQDVNRLDVDDPMIPLLARPGRSLRLSLHFDTGGF